MSQNSARLLVTDRFSIHEFAAVLQADGIVPLPRRSDRHCHSTSALNNFIDLTVEDEDDASRQSKVDFLSQNIMNIDPI